MTPGSKQSLWRLFSRDLQHFPRCIIRSPGLVLIGVLMGAPFAEARTWVVPHVLERSGKASNTQFTFDTTVYAVMNDALAPGREGKTAQVDLYLFDQTTGLPMTGSTGVICAPCTFELTAEQRHLALTIDDLITSRGGGFNASVKLGFAVIESSGPGADAVNVQALAVNARTSAFDVSLFDVGAQPLPETASSGQRVLVIPHVVETSGSTVSDPFSFDTTLNAAYVGGVGGVTNDQGAEIDLYLYDQNTGLPMLSATDDEVCNPCTFALGTGGAGSATPRKRSINVDTLIKNAGGFNAGAKLGFGHVVVRGADPGNVVLQGFIMNAHTSAFDLSVFGFEPQPLQAGATARTFVLPHVLERSGLAANTQFTFDTTIFATYSPGLAGTDPGPGATLNLYLYDNAGAPMTGSTGIICQPCSFPLGDDAGGSGAKRKQTINVDNLITENGGGFDTSVKLGFAIATVTGPDPGGVNLQSFGMNSHTSAFDASVFGFEPQEVPAPGEPKRAFVIPHVLEREGTINNTQFTFDTTVFATYSGGRAGLEDGGGASIRLYLYDRSTGGYLTGNSGTVCAPCVFPLNAAAPKTNINIEALIQAAGGFDVSVKQGSALMVIEGDASRVSFEGFINNALTSPFDLSLFAFEPQPLDSSRLSPFALTIRDVAGARELSMPTVIGYQYTVETRGDLEGDLWWLPWTTVDGNGLEMTLWDLEPPGERRFYRAFAH